jgi:Ca-activated chloride channel homolog
VITLDAQTGVDAADRRYLNFLPTSATIVDPRGQQVQVLLPQVAPGRYSASYPVDDDGIYALQVQQTEAEGAIANQSSGFVVPYSPEYRAGGTDENFMEALAKRTGGRLIHEPDQAFLHDLPAVGAPRQLWPYLLVLVALLFVVDVGVRRVRITGPEMRAAYYKVRRRLGYLDEPVAATAPAGVAHPTPSFGLVSSVANRAAAAEAPAPVAPTRQGRLLAAKHRAARR